MANSSGTITAPVSLSADVYPVLGLEKSGEFYDLGYACANSHGKINPWARYKPVRLANVFDSCEPSTNWWKADGNCGFSIKRLTSYKEAASYADGSLNGWEYLPPQGGTSPFRLTDFTGYSHNAVQGLSGFTAPESVSNQFTSASFTCMMMRSLEPLEDSYDRKNLLLSDIAGVAECYFGVYVVKKNDTSRSLRVTATTAGTLSVSVNAYGMTTGDWDIYPFFSTVQIGQSEADKAGSFYSVPYAKARTISVVASYVQLTVTPGELPSSGTTSHTVSFTVKNGSSSAITFKNNTWRVRYTDKSFSDAMTAGENSGTIYISGSSSFTVAANTTQTFTVNVTVSSAIVSSGAANVFISLDSGAYVTFAPMMKDPSQMVQ